jgi:hypothetical protein
MLDQWLEAGARLVAVFEAKARIQPMIGQPVILFGTLKASACSPASSPNTSMSRC